MLRKLVAILFALMMSLQLATPAVAIAAGGGAHHADYTGDADNDGTANWLDSDSDDFTAMDVGLHAFNLALLLAIIYFLAGKTLRQALKDRATGIRKNLADSAKELDQAKKRYEELEARLGRFEDELVTMRANAQELADEEEVKLIERAKAQAVRIADSAERSIRDEANRARNSLRKEAVELAVELAQTVLSKQVKAADQKRLARDFLEALNDNGVN
jgi:F-type H+-transporting ATPase subunit b